VSFSLFLSIGIFYKKKKKELYSKKKFARGANALNGSSATLNKNKSNNRQLPPRNAVSPESSEGQSIGLALQQKYN